MCNVLSLLFSDLPTFDPVDDVYGGAAEGMADASEFPVDDEDEDIPDTGMSLRVTFQVLCTSLQDLIRHLHRTYRTFC